MKRTKKANKVNLFLDSGAYSAMTQGAPINIYEYIEFIKDNMDSIHIYANLDVIGGKGVNAKLSAEATLQNQRIMEDAGLTPIPVFHIGDPFHYLELYVKDYDYIALGGVAKVPTSKMSSWLDTCFSQYICDEAGIPKTKTHGFGVTSLKMMLRYPWYSVDSTSWVTTGRTGSILVPVQKKEGWDFLSESYKVAVSSRSRFTSKPGQHYETMSIGKQKQVREYLATLGLVIGESEFKEVDSDHVLADNEKFIDKKPKDKTVKRSIEVISIPGVANTYQLRDQVNAQYYLTLEKQIQPYPWAFKVATFKGMF